MLSPKKAASQIGCPEKCCHLESYRGGVVFYGCLKALHGRFWNSIVVTVSLTIFSILKLAECIFSTIVDNDQRKIAYMFLSLKVKSQGHIQILGTWCWIVWCKKFISTCISKQWFEEDSFIFWSLKVKAKVIIRILNVGLCYYILNIFQSIYFLFST